MKYHPGKYIWIQRKINIEKPNKFKIVIQKRQQKNSKKSLQRMMFSKMNERKKSMIDMVSKVWKKASVQKVYAFISPSNQSFLCCSSISRCNEFIRFTHGWWWTIATSSSSSWTTQRCTQSHSFKVHWKNESNTFYWMNSFRVSLETLYNGETKSVPLTRKVMCMSCNG